MSQASTPVTTIPRRRWRRFGQLYAEMAIAMFVGMFALGALQSFAGVGVDVHRQPELGYAIMATNMSIGMISIKRYRGHGWPATLEMCGAMYAPIVPLYPMLWLGLIDVHAWMLLAHVAMFPFMLAVLFRRLDEFALRLEPARMPGRRNVRS